MTAPNQSTTATGDRQLVITAWCDACPFAHSPLTISSAMVRPRDECLWTKTRPRGLSEKYDKYDSGLYDLYGLYVLTQIDVSSLKPVACVAFCAKTRDLRPTGRGRIAECPKRKESRRAAQTTPSTGEWFSGAPCSLDFARDFALRLRSGQALRARTPANRLNFWLSGDFSLSNEKTRSSSA